MTTVAPIASTKLLLLLACITVVFVLSIIMVIFDLDEDFATRFGDEFWKLLESVTSVRAHVNLQS